MQCLSDPANYFVVGNTNAKTEVKFSSIKVSHGSTEVSLFLQQI